MPLLTGCSKETSGANSDNAASGNHPLFETLTLKYQGGTGMVTFPELAEDLGYLAPVKLDYIGNTTGGPHDIQTLVTGDVDFGTAFNGAIVKLKATGAPVKAVIASYGSDEETWHGCFVNEDSPIKTARDLIGKKIAVNTLGAHHEFIIKEYLKRNGLSGKEIEQVELVAIPPVNFEQVLRSRQVDAAILFGIIRDMALTRGHLRLLFKDIELYGPFTAGAYVFKEEFIEKHPHTVEKFVDATARAIEWARVTPQEEVVARFRQIIARRGRNENDLAISYWKSTGIAAKGGQVQKEEFQTWIDWLVRDGRLHSGEIKAEDIYDNRFNPYRLDASKPLETARAQS
jgi:ABC-type nitrate/sulfonate/bicarbonate transport system substrate-binding protein